MLARRVGLGLTLGLGIGLSAQGQTLTYPTTANSYANTDTLQDERPQVVSDGSGTWVAVWDAYTFAGGATGTDLDCFVARSTDNGATWSTAAPLNTNATTDSRDDLRPFLATDEVGNWVAVWSSNDSLGGTIGTDYDILFSLSSNNGVTWTAPAALNTNAAIDAAQDGIPKIATDTFGNWVAVWDTPANIGGSGTDYDVFVARSTNSGATWTAPELLNSNGTVDAGVDSRVELVTDRDGNWVVIWAANANLGGATGNDNDIFVSRSSNNGLTWSPIALLNSYGTTDAADDQRPGLASDGAGAWVAVWHTNYNSLGSGSDYDVRVSRSTDNGQTWTVPAVLNSNGYVDSGTDEFARVMSDGTGNWLATWDANANFAGSGTDYDSWFARSTNNGQTWTAQSLLNTSGNVDGYYDLVPQLATDRQGNWIGIWESNDPLDGAKGFDWDILYTRFTLAPLTVTASSIIPATTGPTNASSLNFSVGFSQSVVNFDAAADLVITHSGTTNSGATISGGPQNYTVSVNGISGTGSFTLAVSTSSGVQGSAGGTLISSVTSAAVAIDNTSPTITLSSAAGDPVSAGIVVTAVLSESTTNFTAGDISTVNANVSGFAGSGANYGFTLTPASPGLFSASVAASSFADAAGNANTASNEISRTAVIVSPTVALTSAAGDPVNGGITVGVTLSSISTDFVESDLTTTNAAVSGFAGAGVSYSFVLTPLSSGEFSAFVPAGVFTDGDTNSNLASNTLSRTADLASPTATLDSLAAGTVNAAITVTVVLSESSADFGSGDVAVLNAAVSNFSGVGANYSFSLTPLTSGQFSASVPAGSFSDAAGNLNLGSNVLSRTADVDGPAVTLSSLAGDPVTAPIGVSVTLSEPSANFAATDLVPVNAVISAFSGTGAAYTFTLTPIVSGLFSASVPVGALSDAAGNLNTASNTLTRTANVSNEVGITPTVGALLNTDGETDARADERPQIETDGQGNWVAVWDGFGGPTGFDLDIFVSRSTDNGQTWSAPALLNANGATDAGDDLRPALATNRAGVWVAVWYSDANLGGVSGSDFDIVYVRSTNAGQTWSAPALLNTNATEDGGNDEIPRIAVDAGNNWVAVWDSNQNMGGAGADYDVFVARSSNGGLTWSAPALLNSNALTDAANDIRTELVTDRLGNWVVAWASNASLGAPVADNFDIFVSRSSDNGVTWAPMTRIDSNDVDDMGEDARPALATDGLGSWVAAWHANDNLGGLSGLDNDIFVSRSINNGATWTASTLLNSNGNADAGEDEFVRLQTDGEGNWFAIWDSSENVGGTIGTDYDVLIARSTNTGVTWTPPTALDSNASIDSGFDLVAQLATDRLGNWVATWESNDPRGGVSSEWDILFSRFFLSAGLRATSIVPATVGPTTADSVNFNVAFTEDAVNFNNAADVVIAHSGTANAGVTISGGPQNFLVSVTGISGNGSFTVAASLVSDIQNASGGALRSSVTSVPVAIDNLAPTILLASAAPGTTNAPIAVTATLSESSANFGADDITTVNGTVSNFAGAGVNYSFTLTPVASGTFSASVAAGRFTDAAGNGNDASNTLSRTADLATPTIVLASGAASVVRVGITVTATLSLASTNFAAGDVTPVNATVSNFAGSGTAYTFTLTPLASGAFSATVAAGTFSSAVGNLNTASNTLSRTADLTPPTVVLASTSGGSVNAAIVVTATLSESSTNFTSGDVAVVNSTLSGFTGSGTSYTFTLTPTATGVFSATVNAGTFTDAVGNNNLVSNTLSRTFDTARPSITLSSASVSPVNAAITINATLSESSTNFAAADITTVNGTVSNFTGAGTAYSFTLTPLANGTFSASVASNRFTDAAGNTNTSSNTLSRTADLTPPTITLSSGAATTVRLPITVNVTLSQSSTNFAAGDVTRVNATLTAFSGSGTSYSFTLTPLASGAFSATVAAGTFTDTAGNGNLASNTISRTADLTPPTATLSSTAGNPVTGPIVVTAVLTESSTNFNSNDVARVNCSISNFSGSGTNYTFTLTPNAAGVFTAVVNAGRFTDPVGNQNTVSNTLSRTRS